MRANDLSVALTCLRAMRGWTREDLARASGLPQEDVSAYEEGEKLPDVKATARLLDALGYGIDEVNRVRRLVRSVGSVEPLSWTAEWPLPWPPEDSRYRNATRADLAWEIHRLAAEAGKAINGLAQITLVLVERAIPNPILTTDDGE